MRIFLLLLAGALMHAARSFYPLPSVGSTAGGVALACGYLLLTAFLAGGLAKSVGLPKLTGYLASGVIVGPELLDLVSHNMLESLSIFSGVATALIALTAGLEMELRAIRSLLRPITWISLLAVAGTTVLLAAAVYLIRDLLPFTAGLGAAQVVAVALVLAITLVAQSPAVTVALRDEVEADGPLSRTVIGVVVLGEFTVLAGFAVLSSVAIGLTGGSAGLGQLAARISWELFGSLLIGALLGALAGVYFHFFRGGQALFVVIFGLVIAEVGRRVHLDPLLIALATGIYICNLTRHGHRLHEAIEYASLPIYVVFFSVAGASMHLGALQVVGPPALLLVVVRAAGLWSGARVAAKIAQAPEPVRRYAGFGLMPQAGLAIALALVFAETFPQFGAEASALVLSVVAINELVAPPLYRIALLRSGEAGKKRTEGAETVAASIPGEAAAPAPGS